LGSATLLIGKDVGDVNRTGVENGPPLDSCGIERSFTSHVRDRRTVKDRTVMGDPLQRGPVTSVDDGILGLAEPGNGLSDRVQHPLLINGRLCDDPQHLRRRRLLLQRPIPLSLGPDGSLGSDGFSMPQRSSLRLQLCDPRVRIVRHHVHLGCIAPLRDGARIARGRDAAL
jgi:hypothetical protein